MKNTKRKDNNMASKDNSGNLFKNTFKEEGTKQPDYKGEVMINGTVMKASLWLNKDKNGKTYFGLGFQSMEEAAKYSKANSTTTAPPTFAESQATPPAPADEDIPF